ncbi:CDC42 small effector protein 1 isoform X1 [Balaenoptera ricei]|uniref:CDC42 small effector protein 1 isoform X1 n=1 Tax=Balaenoptera ricei TaxID=2746895 RepID=UPI0028BD59DE|nr:CDC42 small effector protein 1 isoform X1 [Balaenoptera ricei]
MRVLLPISELGGGPEDLGAPLPFAPQRLTRKRNARFWRVQLRCQAFLEGPLSRVFPAGAAALGGFRGPSHVPPSCSATSVQSGAVRPAPSRTGFVIASRPFPPSASRTSAAPPSAPPPRRGASPGTPRWRAPSGSPPPAGAGRLDAGAEQGSRSVEDITLYLLAHATLRPC